MKNILLSALLLLFVSVIAQKEVPTKEEIVQFKKSKTYVVLEDNPYSGYNFKIKEAIKNAWNTTEYEFISQEEYDNKRMETSNSFITLDKVWFTKDKLKAQYNFLCLSLGGDYKNSKDMPQLCTVPVSYADVDEDNYLYKLSSLLQIIEDHISFVENTPGINKVNVKQRINLRASEIKTKELYLVKDELAKDINSESKLKKLYPYKFKFVSREELEKAIDDKKPNVVFLHKVGPEGTEKKARCYKTIIGTEHSKMYYFDYHMISSKKPDGLLAKDIKKIANAR